MTLLGHYTETGTSRPREALLRLDGDLLTVSFDGQDITEAARAVRFSARLAGVPRRIEFPDGSNFTTPDNDGADSLLAILAPRQGRSLIDRLERRWLWALVAVIALPVSLWVLFTWGMPVVAKPVAHALPDRLVYYLDDAILDVLETHVLQPSTLTPEHQASVMQLVEQLPGDVKVDLLIRGGGDLDANALALPGGTVILTDELVQMTTYDGELLAILAHEAGHVKHQHGLRNLIQSFGALTVLGWVFGDLTLVTDIALVSVPAVLQQLSYSRDFEAQADEYARTVLVSQNYPVSCMASVMEKLQARYSNIEDALPGFIRSHPQLEARIAASADAVPCTY
jgi:Zn-dependent protease with chaperone function